ncbi:MAG TPA: 4-hydroxy-tetrahydrodipicolinate synthase [Clostridiales bacterium]|nr:4-hydroxy-tetrahydrodipicolinate synthase [Clostridiales bacterium]
MSIFKGSGVAIVTPFSDKGINFDAFERHIEFQIANKTDAIIVCGTTGEPSTMTKDEKEAVIKFAVDKVNKRVPVIAGTGGNNTAEVVEASKKAEALGADGLLVVTPYYNRATQRGLIEHYKRINDAVNIPIIVYNVPGRTTVNITPETLKELSNLENIKGMKEASGNIVQITEMARLCGDKIDLYSGNDDHIVPVLSVGGIGVISVVANIAPRDTHDLVMKFLDGDIVGSRQLQFKLNPLVKALFLEVNPIPVKTALNLIGFDAGKPRLPLTPMADNNLEILKKRLTEYGFQLK